MTIRFRRQHALGLAEMRKLVKPWLHDLTTRYGLQSFVVEGQDADVVKFSRPGIDGEVAVAGDHIEVSAQFGFLFAAFGQTIGAEIEKNLDAFLADARRVAAAADPKDAAPGRAASPRRPRRKA